MTTPPHEQQSATLLCHGKWWEKMVTTVYKCAWCTERPIRKTAWHYSCISWRTSLVPRHGKTVWTNFWNWWDDTMRRRYRSRSRSSEKGEHYFAHAWTSENTSPVECWKSGKLQRITRGDWRLLEEHTHLQDDLNRKHTTKIQWKSMQSPQKGKGTEKSSKGKMGGTGKSYGETITEHSRFDWECRNCGKTQSIWLLVQADE